MYTKLKTLYFIVFLVFPLLAFSQNNSPEKPNAIIAQYNVFLKGIGLLGLVEATQFSNIELKSDTAVANGEINVLTLVANSKYQSPIVFAKDWAAIIAKYQGEKKLFELLFSKLADFTEISPSSLKIVFSFRNTHEYEFNIFFDQGIKYKVNGINFRDDGTEGAGDFDNSSYGGQIDGVIQTPDLRNKIKAGLFAYFKTLKHEKQIDVKLKTWDDEHLLKYEIRNVKGEVTGKYNEVIFVNLFFMPGKDKLLNIYYLFTVKYQSGIFMASDNEQHYIDAVIRYENKVSAFGINLKGRIKKFSGIK